MNALRVASVLDMMDVVSGSFGGAIELNSLRMFFQVGTVTAM